MNSNPAPDGGASVWALLVGINDYASPNISDLGGCVNDLNGLRAFLIDCLGVPPNQIAVLTDAAANRAAILDTFQRFLVDNPDIPFGSQLLFSFSGHGSRMRTEDPLELDGYDETLLPHDARTVDPDSGERIYDIPDKTLGGLIDRLAAAKGDHITVILDCCHSGSGTRDALGPVLASVRQAPPELTAAPADLDAGLRARPAARGGASAWAAARENHVLLAGCRDGESSYEYAGEEGRFGALSYFLLQELQSLRPGTTYAELHERVAARVNGVFRAQLPQCEGDRDREVLGGARINREPFLSLGTVSGDQVTLSGGLAHGLAAGARLAVYPPELRSRSEASGAPLAHLRVSEVSATTARARIEPATGGQLPELPPHARAIVTERGYGGSAQTVALVAEDPALATVLGDLAAAVGGSAHLELASDPDLAQLRVRAANGSLRILDAGGELLVDPAAIGIDPARALAALESIARFRALVALRNRGASLVQGRVGLALRRYQAGTEPRDMPLVTAESGGRLALPWRPEAEADAEAHRYLLEVQNHAPLPLYPHVFFLGSDHAITRLYPRQGETVAIPPGQSAYPRRQAGALFRVFLNPGEAASRDTLLVILTAEPTDLAVLEQAALARPRAAERSVPGSGLAGLVAAFAAGRGSRGGGPDEPGPGEDWGVAELAFDVVRAAATQDLPPGIAEVDLGAGLSLTKPPAFAGTVTVTAQAAARGGESWRTPPALAQPTAALRPLDLTAGRDGAGGGLVLELAADAPSRALVSEATPLVLDLPPGTLAAGEEVLALAFDGEDYLLAGGGTGDQVHLVQVPEPVLGAWGPESVGGEARDVQNLVRFFLYKKLGRPSQALGLRRLVLEGGRLRRDSEGRPIYATERPRAADFVPGQSVALIVHGFSDDTRGLAATLVDPLRRDVRAYDQVLTFDYETFGTSAAESGENLARALRQQCGLAADDGVTVHVFAHSMGCLVTRCLVERSGGHELIDAAVLAGPPNRGTPAANASRGLAYLASALLGHLAPVTPVGLLSLPLAWLTAQGQGWADLVVDSALTRELNGLSRPDNVPYLVLAGANELDSATGDRWRRLARKTLGDTLLFNEANDGVIGTSSMTGLRGGGYPALAIEGLACDHFTYYGSATTALIRDWLAGVSP